jgi:hypothetical protein
VCTLLLLVCMLLRRMLLELGVAKLQALLQ